MDVFAYNQYISECFSKKPSAAMLSKYVMSEMLSPIEDYYNAIKLIRENYPTYSDTSLLIIGAYLISEWLPGSNDLLEILNNRLELLSMSDQAIVYYLNAHHLRRTEKNYSKNPYYLENLRKSTEIEVPFVRNRLYLAEMQSDKKIFELMFRRALANIKKVYSKQEIMEMTKEHFLSPQTFIEEFILQTHISYLIYESIQQQYGSLENDGFTNA